jgi:hypothetical protein
MHCRHLGKAQGTRRSSWGKEPQYACAHPRHKKATLAGCLLCPEFCLRVERRQFSPPKGPLDLHAPDECLHPTGVIVDRYGREAALADLYYGATAFLVLGGPSTRRLPLELLGRRGVLILSVNNCPAVLPPPLRPHVWLHTDPTGKFHDSIWRDPAILKIVPVNEWGCCRVADNRGIFQKVDGRFELLPGVRGRDMPGVLGFERNTAFFPERWLFEPSINRGNDKEHAEGNAKKGIESNGWPQCINTMFAALRLAFYLGIRRLYLVGADFSMEENQPYAFAQGKSVGGVRSNNHSYAKMCAMFDALLPLFESQGFEVFNTNPDSGLWTFPFRDFGAAIDDATASFQQVLDTEGWYREAANPQKPQEVPKNE